ncbi:hypothetical protein QYM36_015171 [Artemia franciscana]|uniref:Calcineurin-like phosphoesterase domain-containing protein n=1 Tax=Artemia franciscana TaxID=6661 RepID=A0AA88KZ14_ARTSF|nr:hypothetical protein QYM36_015171 [Artemia franciscana]
MRSDLCGLKFHMHSNFLSGYENENIITRWDSDRYLRSTFQVASNFFKPDIVVFLGDLTDEGSLSNDQLFSEYASRFMTLFHVDSSVKTIYLPGDNDIGGEGNDPFLPSKLERFTEEFGKIKSHILRTVEFIPVNRIASESSLPEKCKNDSLISCVVLSHIPVNVYGKEYASHIMIKINPLLTISAHEHSSFVIYPKMDPLHIEDINDFSVHNFKSDESVEIVAPTCSYRMGKQIYGFGALVIGDNKIISYNVLWSPSRFVALIVYGFFVLIVCFVVCLRISSWFILRTMGLY